MDGPSPPQDILDQIFAKSAQAPPPPQAGPPGGDGPPPGSPDPGPSGPGGDGGQRTAKLLPWLCALLGGTLLVLGVCVFQLAWMSARLDELQQVVEQVQNADDLREEIEQYRGLNQELRQAHAQAVAEKNAYYKEVIDARHDLFIAQIQRERAACLSYLGQFLAHEDYEMATLVVALSGEGIFSDLSVDEEPIPIDPAQMSQYTAYRDILLTEGYLKPVYRSMTSSSPDLYTYAEGHAPIDDPYIYGLADIWMQLYRYHMSDDYYSVAQWIVQHQDEGCPENASPYTAGLYEQLVQTMIENDWLKVTEDGRLDYGDVALAFDGPYYVYGDPAYPYFE